MSGVAAFALKDDPRQQVVHSTRPWGHFVQFVANETVTVKTLDILPGQRLSLQRHRERAEMWYVLQGGGLQATVGAITSRLSPGEMVWVPTGEVHRLTNRGHDRGVVLEIAFGHFDEDDIKRLQDDYERA